MDTKPYLVRPGQKVRLDKLDTRGDGGLSKEEGTERFEKLMPRIDELQELMYAQNKHALLVVLQAMDAGGKDSTIRQVFAPVDPAGCYVFNFKAPNENDLAHDFLWRIHANVPRRGIIGVFNRSHYEDVLIVRVKNLVPEARWKKRYGHIADFERLISDEGTVVRKFFLHISKGYQKERLQRRLDNPDKHWKFNPADLLERAHWDDYQHAYEEAIERTSTDACPWYIVPAERRWFRNLIIAQVLVDTLESLKMQHPKPTFDPKAIVIE